MLLFNKFEYIPFITNKKKKRKLYYINYLQMKKKKILSLYTITQLCPGYQHIWRRYRLSLRIQIYKKYFRQRRLTNFILLFRGLSGLPLMYSLEFSLINILQICLFFFLLNHLYLYFFHSLVLLNYKKAQYLYVQLYIGDVISLNLGFIYLSYLLLFNTHNIFFKKKLYLYFLKKYKYNFFLKNIFIFFLFKLYWDIPNFLEVDYMTNTIILLYSPLTFLDLNYINYKITLPIFSLRIYNWKYIT